MNVISSSALGLSNSALQRDLQQVMRSQEAISKKNQPENRSEQPHTEQRSTFGASLYDVYGLEKGFSKNPDGGDSVEISQLAKMLYQAEQDREVWSGGSDKVSGKAVLEKDGTISRNTDSEYLNQIEPNLLSGEASFDGLFKEAISEDGGTILRRINSENLDQITTVEEALYLYEKFHESAEGKMVISLGEDASEILLKLHSLAIQDRLDGSS